LIFSPAATLYCLPPVFMTAYISALSRPDFAEPILQGRNTSGAAAACNLANAGRTEGTQKPTKLSMIAQKI
jgi:hypothetical protein